MADNQGQTQQTQPQYQPKLNADAFVLGYLGKNPAPMGFAQGYLAAKPE